MGSYIAAREAAHANHAARQRRFGGGVSEPTKLRNGGAAVEGRADGGRRGDRKGKHHTTINIVMGGQGQEGGQDAQMAHQAGMQQGAQLGARMAAARLAGAGAGPGGPPPGMPPGAGGPPPGMGPGGPPHPPIAGMGGPPPGGPPPMMPGRKRGGRTPGEAMKYGAGSGEGRLEKAGMGAKVLRSVE